MEDQIMLALCTLKGQLMGQRDILRCKIRSAHEARETSKSDNMIMYFTGIIRESVAAMHGVQSAIRDVSQIIKEVQNA
jgi:hypothetical protein